MTALDKYVRLEAIGYWRENAQADPQEVIVSFGDATLQLTSLSDTPITHWAILATKRIGTEGSAVIYSADPSGQEILTIDDTEMTLAITAVTHSISRRTAKPRKFTRYIWIAICVIFLALISQSPPFIYRWTAALTAPARQTDFASQVASQMRQQNLFICENRASNAALAGLADALDPNHALVLKVTKQQGVAVIALPDGQIYLPMNLIHNSDSAASLTAQIALGTAMAQRQAYLRQVLAKSGVIASFKHLFGQNVSFEVPLTVPAPIAQDFITARDYLVARNIDAQPLQQLAATHGFGLPIAENDAFAAFAVPEFNAIQSSCRE